MAKINHPAADEEQKHLAYVLDVTERETASAEAVLAEETAKLREARRFDPDNLPLREMMYSHAEDSLRRLKLAKPKPYFTRVDFIEKGRPKESVYIGKYGITLSSTMESVVADWRAPVANLYYAGQLGRISYETPGGKVEGDVTLKRMIGIEKSELVSIFDTDIAAQDAYLQSVLGEMTGGRLKDIVTTIQSEQNLVIRNSGRESLIVQGVAGAGKTTIALHRIAYLLYTMADRLEPRHMLVLAPNPLFLTFIAGVLPDLGVENTVQSTFFRFAESIIGKIPMTDGDRDAKEGRMKGSAGFIRRLERWLEEYEESFAPAGGIKFGPVTVMTRDEVTRFLLVDEKPFPYERRYTELKKQIIGFMNHACAQLAEGYRRESLRRADEIRAAEAEPARRMERLNKLYESRDKRIAEMKKAVKPMADKAIAAMPDTKPAAIYLKFLEYAANDEDERLAYAAEKTLARYRETGAFTREDVAALGFLTLAAKEVKKPDIRHIVADEAQDLSIAEFLFLRKLLPGAPFTIVGDLMQGMNAWRGLTDWHKMNEAVFGGKAAERTLLTSYRNTVEIMETAMRVAKRHPVPGQTEIRPVLRHGEAPVFARADGFEKRRRAAFDEIAALKKAGMQSIAVLFSDKAERARFGYDGAHVLDTDDGVFTNGIALVMADGVKGLEFDAVILFNASEKAFPDTPEAARVLFVCLTRALHRLTVIYEDGLSKLFDIQEDAFLHI